MKILFRVLKEFIIFIGITIFSPFFVWYSYYFCNYKTIIKKDKLEELKQLEDLDYEHLKDENLELIEKYEELDKNYNKLLKKKESN